MGRLEEGQGIDLAWENAAGQVSTGGRRLIAGVGLLIRSLLLGAEFIIQTEPPLLSVMLVKGPLFDPRVQ